VEQQVVNHFTGHGLQCEYALNAPAATRPVLCVGINREGVAFGIGKGVATFTGNLL
jgi:hypothetical protein